VFAGAHWHRGVLGIVASRLVERFGRPAFVLGEEDGALQGSGRSVAGFHLLNALEAMPGMFTRFGGHKQAAGVALSAERLHEFRERLNQYAGERLAPEDFEPRLEVDASADFSELTREAADELLTLAPFGFGNPTPLLALRGAEICGPAAPFKEKHLRVQFRGNGPRLFATAWNFAERCGEFAPGARVDIALCVEEDAYAAARGWPGWRAILKDVRSCAAAQSGA
jgi:single-stranded-DNA-specific exonuclease